MVKIADEPLDLIGNTPMVKLSKIVGDLDIELWAKVEFMNLSGSIKDRIAYYMIRAAEKSGRLKPGMTLVVPTTGNTGIAFSAVGAYLGYKVLIVIPEEMSRERYLIMKLYGAEFFTTPGGETDALGSLEYALELARGEPEKYYVFDQWSDEANVNAHYETTGKEIIEQLSRVDGFVAHVGTGGTLIGIGKRLKESYKEVKVFGAEPAECPVATYWFKKGEKVKCGRHRVEGVGDGFVPEIIMKYREIIDDFITVSSEEAIDMARRLARRESLAVGISSGANVAAALKIAEEYRFKPGSKIVTVLPDSALKYYSTMLFKDI